jgi:hypothetical protein
MWARTKRAHLCVTMAGRRSKATERRLSMLLLPINLTFQYQFAVAKPELKLGEEFGSPSEKICWIGQGSGQADEAAIQRAARVQGIRDAWSPAERDRAELIVKGVRAGLRAIGIEDTPESSPPEEEGLVGPKPKFELCDGWLTLLPTEEWTQPLPVRYFSDAQLLSPGNRYEKRKLKSFSLYVGDTLQNLLQASDTLWFSRNELGAFSYRLERNSEVILSAGGVGDKGGPVTLWQEYDSEPNPNVGQTIGGLRVAERIDVTRPYVSVRISDQVFHLLAGQDAYVDPHYLFLARSNYHDKGFHMMPGYALRAVYAAGRIDRKELTKELIENAAHQLTASKTRIL